MKCAKCGYDIDPGAAACPHCAAGRVNPDRFGTRSAAETIKANGDANRACCPVCGSPDVYPVRRNFDPGCGCLGLLLFGWIGILLGLLGAGDVEMVCGHCGARWKPGR